MSEAPASVDLGSIQAILAREGSLPELPVLHGSPLHDKPTWWENLLKSLNDFFGKLFAHQTGPSEFMTFVGKHLAVIIWIGLVLCLVVLIVYLARRFYGRYLEKPLTRPQHRLSEFAPDALADAFRQAMLEKKWALASRLRWRLFLVRIKMPRGTTPSEATLATGGSDRLMFDYTLQEQLAEQELQSLLLALDRQERVAVPGKESGFGREQMLVLAASALLVLAFFGNLARQSFNEEKLNVRDIKSAYHLNVVKELRQMNSTSSEQDLVLELDRDLDQPFLREEDLPWKLDSSELSAVLLVLSPRIPFSSHEARVLRDQISRGLKVYFSFHDKTSALAVSQSLNLLGLDFTESFEANPQFTSGQIEEVFSPSSFANFTKGQSYGFYSPYVIPGMTCEMERFLCFVREKQLGRGEVTVVAGLFPAAGSMLRVEGNQKFTTLLAAEAGPLYVDRYHLLQGDRDWKDLMSEPFFLFPMATILLGMMAYMIWGAESLPTQGYRVLALIRPGQQRTRPVTADSWHALSRRILQKTLSGQINKIETAILHGELLSTYFQYRRIPLQDNLPSRVSLLIQLHIAWLEKNTGWRATPHPQSSLLSIEVEPNDIRPTANSSQEGPRP